AWIITLPKRPVPAFSQSGAFRRLIQHLAFIRMTSPGTDNPLIVSGKPASLQAHKTSSLCFQQLTRQSAGEFWPSEVAISRNSPEGPLTQFEQFDVHAGASGWMARRQPPGESRNVAKR